MTNTEPMSQQEIKQKTWAHDIWIEDKKIKDLIEEELKGLRKLLHNTGEYADFSGRNLKGAKFSCERLDHVDFSNAILDGATICTTSFRGCNFSHASIKNADLKRVDFQDANLTGAVFTGSSLDDSNFVGAYILEDGNQRLVNYEYFKDASSIKGAKFVMSVRWVGA